MIPVPPLLVGCIGPLRASLARLGDDRARTPFAGLPIALRIERGIATRAGETAFAARFDRVGIVEPARQEEHLASAFLAELFALPPFRAADATRLVRPDALRQSRLVNDQGTCLSLHHFPAKARRRSGVPLAFQNQPGSDTGRRFLRSLLVPPSVSNSGAAWRWPSANRHRRRCAEAQTPYRRRPRR
jgi:hypothetical protein